jgi:hypothetical protein
VTIFDDPNREALGLAPIWTGSDNEPEQPTEGESLDTMTKDQLVEYAEANGIEVSASWTKAEIRAAIDDAAG